MINKSKTQVLFLYVLIAGCLVLLTAISLYDKVALLLGMILLTEGSVGVYITEHFYKPKGVKK